MGDDYVQVEFLRKKGELIENLSTVSICRETALLFDPVKSSESDKQRVVAVVAHELAHQW